MWQSAGSPKSEGRAKIGKEKEGEHDKSNMNREFILAFLTIVCSRIVDK